MKKLLLLSIVMLMLLSASPLYAIDSTFHIRTYSDQGHTAGYIVNQGFQAVFDADGNYGISTTNRYQLSRKSVTVPLSLTTASAGDTFYVPILTVPTGLTFTVESITLTAAVEATGAGVGLGEITFTSIVADTTALDTVVAKIEMDADSAIAYADTIYTMTLLDSIFAAGSIISWHQYNEAACVIEGPSVTVKYRQDE